ncbi:deoxyhypusine synthase family protein [Candidatus Micrarchaeota archaeon]|nr:deoxyhypusine synthase family protein [Candidatus Micrarchaeota archaeon]
MVKKYVHDIRWHPGITVDELVDMMDGVGFQSTRLKRASDLIVKMKKSGAKIYLTFTSNMVTSGLRGLFAQLIKLGLVDIIVTTVGGIEEDIMKAKGEKFILGTFNADDVELHERGMNRIGNIYITNESYEHFEGTFQSMLKHIYDAKKTETKDGLISLTPSDLFREIGLKLKDENSILYQAARKGVPIFCPAVTDGALGFHLFMFKQDHQDFHIDVVGDFANIIFSTSQDEKKGIISLGGGVSKHHAILAALINGGMDYAVYMTTSRQTSGSMSGATTNEAKSWGKIKDDSEAVTVIGDVTIVFPLAVSYALSVLHDEGLIDR